MNEARGPARTTTDDTSIGAVHAPFASPRLSRETSGDNNGAYASSMADVDREVEEAMAAMSSADGAAARGDFPTNESIQAGTEMTGSIVAVSQDDVFIEFNAKSQGLLPRNQFGKKESVEVGRRVDVVVDRYDANAGMLILNRKGAVQRATWTNLAVGALVQGRVTGLIKGGLEVDLKGIRAFMPASQVSIGPMKDISVLLNEQVTCEVMEFNRRAKNVVVSRRKALEKERAEAREKLRAELEVGQTRKGIVVNITEFGAFVDFGGLEGLVHIRDLSWGTVDKVSDVLSPGQEVEVQVLKIDDKRGRISLGLKQVQPDPWVNIEERYPEGTTLSARIVRTANFGAFAELEPGVEGLIPISEMGWQRVNNVRKLVSPGDMVSAVVIRVEPEKRRLALSMKQAQPDPWAGVLESFTAQSVTPGKVTRLTDFGAFVEIAPGVEGLVHISQLADKHVRACSDVVQVGQEVEARVLGVDKEQRRISLSLKKEQAPAERHAHEPSDDHRPSTHKKHKRPLRGGLSSHFDW